MGCGAMEQTSKEKNLLDLRHQRFLSYVNISAISAISIALSFYLAELQGLLANSAPYIFTDLAVAAILLAYFFKELRDAEHKIEVL